MTDSFLTFFLIIYHCAEKEKSRVDGREENRYDRKNRSFLERNVQKEKHG